MRELSGCFMLFHMSRVLVFVFSLTAEWAKKLGESDVIPLTVDPSGLYFRRDGRPGSRTMLCGVSPPEDQDKDYPFISSQEEFEELKHDIDYSLFEETMWPILAKRSAAFEQIKLQGAWSGLYDYNTLDRKSMLFGASRDLRLTASFEQKTESLANIPH